MLLAIDIGNSNITLGGIQEGEILFEARLATDSTKTSDEYGVEIKDMLDLFGARVEEIRDCIVASVVPQMMGHFGRYFEIIRAVFPDLDTPIMATAPRSWAVVQVAWEMAEVTLGRSYTSRF